MDRQASKNIPRVIEYFAKLKAVLDLHKLTKHDI